MAYPANVIQVMIVSPSDASAEREAVRAELREFNHIHAREKSAVLLDVGWDTHSTAELGARAQQIINERVLASSDVVIAVFRHRVGTPTGGFASGSVEEITRHHGAGKLAMVYFSDESPPPDADQPQLADLSKFRAWCKEQGIVRPFRDVADLARLVSREIRIAMHDNPQLQRLAESAATSGGIGTPGVSRASPGSTLSTEARALIQEAARDNDGLIVTQETLQGWSLITNGRTMNEETARSAAIWRGAMEQLVDQGFAVAINAQGSVFQVSDRGFIIADSLRAFQPAGGDGGNATAEAGGGATGGPGGNTGSHGPGGDGGTASARGPGSKAFGGPGGRGGVGLAMPGMSTSAENGETRLGGGGGESPQADGRGGRGASTRLDLAGLPDVVLPNGKRLSDYGRGGDGASSAQYTARRWAIHGFREAYFGRTPRLVVTGDTPESAVPIVWLNEQLALIGSTWRARIEDGAYVFFDV